jgi:5-methylcytosine-specific restriction enzyme subunit McrC
MRRITLKEFEPSSALDLSSAEVDAFQRLAPQIRVEPARGQTGRYTLTPDAHVGVIRFADTLIEIRPKLPIDRLFFLLSYAVDPSSWGQEHIELGADDSVLEAVAPAFCRLVSQATRRGLLHGYRAEQQAISLIRGQVRFADQVQRRYGFPIPVEVTFDDFTADIDENRVLLAALHLLRHLPIRSQPVRQGLHEIISAFDGVTLVRMGRSHVPVISFTRLNQHYQPAVNLATLILRWSSLELGPGSTAGTCFLIDMNRLFEMFVHRALREELGLSESAFPRGRAGLCLDMDGRIRMAPDLSWWAGPRCRFIGDVKYKKVNVAGVEHHDLYQLLAYLTATGLPAGILVYAAGEGNPAKHHVQRAGKHLIVEALDLAGKPEQVLAQIRGLATQVRAVAC